ncbi:LCP family protein [Ornithinibacillus salinisoli]|uniref:LCP family protein n=1 Tax=Ornithinibacillus salinisoli TaxID=1848459 RepID=A0ABW4W134_9BACI
MDNKELFSFMDDEDLNFTKQDRVETLRKIQNKNESKTSLLMLLGKRYFKPVMSTITVLLLSVGLLLSTLISGNNQSQEDPNNIQSTYGEVGSYKNDSFSVLIFGKDSTNYRYTINILLTYNGEDKSIQIVPIPRDTYVEIYNSEGEMVREDKLSHASINSNPETVLTTVSNLFDLPIDYYSVIPIEKINEALEVDNKIQENDMEDLIKERLTFPELKNLMKENKTNIPRDILNQFQLGDIYSESIQLINLKEGLKDIYIDGVYYVEVNQDFLEKTSNALKQHVGKKDK